MARIIEFTGTVLVGPDQERHGLWAVDGRLTFNRPPERADVVLDGWVLPGFVDAHCHIGLGPGGAVDDDVAHAQAMTDRNAGTLLVRDAGAASDTRWLQQTPDAPRIIRAGRHIARTRRYLRNFAVEVEPEELVEAVRKQARSGDGARSPASRSIQSPTSLTQPSPARACFRTASTRSSGSTSTAKLRR